MLATQVKHHLGLVTTSLVEPVEMRVRLATPAQQGQGEEEGPEEEVPVKTFLGAAEAAEMAQELEG
jgi:hypothetical protein